MAAGDTTACITPSSAALGRLALVPCGYHHMALVMLGTLFLLKQKKAGRQQWPMLSFNDLVTALAHLLPRRQLTAEELADVINKRHDLRQKAKESHARRSQVALE